MFEYEIKVKIIQGDINEILKKLESIGFRVIDYRFEEDFYVDLRSCRDVKPDSVLRIRKVVRKDGVSGELTFKGPRISDKIKLREELSVKINEPDTLREVFKKLGFKLFSVRKRRHVAIRGRENVFIDNVESLGTFIEYEVINARGIDEFMKMFNKFIRELNINVSKPIIKSYLELILEGRHNDSNYINDRLRA